MVLLPSSDSQSSKSYTGGVGTGGAWGWSTDNLSKMGVAFVPQIGKVQSNVIGNEFDLAGFLDKFFIIRFLKASQEDVRDDILERIDAADLYIAMKDLNKFLFECKIENHILKNFLELHDPKLLIGLKNVRNSRKISTILKIRTQSNATGILSDRTSMYSVGSLKHSPSTITTVTTSTVRREYGLNFRTKFEMAEKEIYNVEKRAHEFQSKAIAQIKLMTADAEEKKIHITELLHLKDNFLIHFKGTDKDLRFLRKAPIRKLEAKLRKYVNSWCKNATILLERLRITLSFINKNCHRLNDDYKHKIESSQAHITPADFKKIFIRMQDLQNEYDEKSYSFKYLKQTSAKYEIELTLNKNLMSKLENSSAKLKSKSRSIINNIFTLDRSMEVEDNQMLLYQNHAKALREEMKAKKAPSVNDYQDVKINYANLEKEDKKLMRRLKIAQMQLSHLRRIMKM